MPVQPVQGEPATPLAHLHVVMHWAPATAPLLSSDQRAELEGLVRAPRTPQKLVVRARIVLAVARGEPNNAIASQLVVSRPTVILWRERHPKPFEWHTSADLIPGKVARCTEALVAAD